MPISMQRLRARCNAARGPGWRAGRRRRRVRLRGQPKRGAKKTQKEKQTARTREREADDETLFAEAIRLAEAEADVLDRRAYNLQCPRGDNCP